MFVNAQEVVLKSLDSCMEYTGNKVTDWVEHGAGTNEYRLSHQDEYENKADTGRLRCG